jgi:hypothetical protein
MKSVNDTKQKARHNEVTPNSWTFQLLGVTSLLIDKLRLTALNHKSNW